MHIPAASEDGFYTEAGTSPDPGKKKAVLKSTAKNLDLSKLLDGLTH